MGALVAVPAVASAEVYCVGVSGGACTQSQPDFQSALMAAAANGGDDTVQLGAGTFTAANSFGFTYPNGSAGKVAIIGAGQGQTNLTTPSDAGDTFYVNSVLSLSASGGGSSVADLTVTLPAPVPPDTHNSQYRGINLDLSQVNRVTVTGPQVKTNSIALWVHGGPVIIDQSSVSLALRAGSISTGVIADASLRLTQSALTADNPANLRATAGGTTYDLSRDTLRAPVVAVGVSGGTLNISNSTIEALDAGGQGLAVSGNQSGFAETPVANADHLTIVGDPGAKGIFANAGDPTVADTSTVGLTNSVISGPTTPIQASAGSNDVVTLNTDFSNYNPVASQSTSGGGMVNATETNRTTLAPGFVDPASGNYHLLATSPLIDIGNPIPPGGTEFDIDGDPRGLSATPIPCLVDTPGPRDIGADEYSCVAPDTAITSGPAAGATVGSGPTFAFSSTESQSTFQCSLDGGSFTPCSSPFVPALGDGSHTLGVAAVDANANVDPTPATRSFKIDATAPGTTISGKTKLKAKKRRARGSFALASTEPGSTFECSVDGTAFAACSSPLSASLRKGTHVIRARAKDAVGNQDASPASITVKVKKKKPKPR